MKVSARLPNLLLLAVAMFESAVCFAVGKLVFFFAVAEATQMFLQVSIG